MKLEPIQIDDPDTVRDIHALADRRGVPAEKAVAEAVRDKLGEAAPGRVPEQGDLLADVMKIVARFNALPVVGQMLTDSDLYDAQGMPR